jgi:hypothetical protein
MNIKFPHQPGPMGLGGLYADSQESGNFLTGLSFADELKNLALPRGKWIGRQACFGQKRFHNRAGNTRAEINLSATDLLNGVEKVSGRLLL